MFFESFKDYTERRIKTYDVMKNYFPEHYNMNDINFLRNAYAFEEHLIFCKNKFESMIDSKITWESSEQIYNQIQGISNEKLYDKMTLEELVNVDTFEKYIELSIVCKKELFVLLGITFTEDLYNYFKKAFNEDEFAQTDWGFRLSTILIKKQVKEGLI